MFSFQFGKSNINKPAARVGDSHEMACAAVRSAATMPAHATPASLLPVIQYSMAAITSVIRTNTDSMKEIVTKLEDNIREKTRVSLTAYMKIAGKYIINVVIGFVIAGNRKLEGGE